MRDQFFDSVSVNEPRLAMVAKAFQVFRVVLGRAGLPERRLTDQAAVQPPSIDRFAPVIDFAASPHR